MKFIQIGDSGTYGHLGAVGGGNVSDMVMVRTHERLIRHAGYGVKAVARASRVYWDRVGPAEGEERIEGDAEAYWTDLDARDWKSNSHWREGLGDQWEVAGRANLSITERLVGTTCSGWPGRRTVEWGCGGGANAVQLAPRCDEFVAVDVVEASLVECEARVREVADTPLRKVLVPMSTPETAVQEIGPACCDLFVSFYVFELVPSKAYGVRLLDIAQDLLQPGGVAVIQVKYATTGVRSRPRRRKYRRGLANMTTYAIDEFWSLGVEAGLSPRAVVLVPKNELDERYAYFGFVKEADA